MDTQALEIATTNSYVSLLKCKLPNFKSVTLVVSNSDDADDLTAQILVSNDPAGATGWTNLELNSGGDVELVIGEVTSKSFDLPLFHWIDVQVKSTTANPAKANAWLNAR